MPDEIDIDLGNVERDAWMTLMRERIGTKPEPDKRDDPNYRDPVDRLFANRIAEGDSWDRTATYGLTPPDWGQ